MIKVIIFMIAVGFIMYPYCDLVSWNLQNLFPWWRLVMLGIGMGLIFLSGFLDGLDTH